MHDTDDSIFVVTARNALDPLAPARCLPRGGAGCAVAGERRQRASAAQLRLCPAAARSRGRAQDHQQRPHAAFPFGPARSAPAGAAAAGAQFPWAVRAAQAAATGHRDGRGSRQARDDRRVSRGRGPLLERRLLLRARESGTDRRRPLRARSGARAFPGALHRSKSRLCDRAVERRADVVSPGVRSVGRVRRRGAGGGRRGGAGLQAAARGAGARLSRDQGSLGALGGRLVRPGRAARNGAALARARSLLGARRAALPEGRCALHGRAGLRGRRHPLHHRERRPIPGRAASKHSSPAGPRAIWTRPAPSSTSSSIILTARFPRRWA